MKVLLGNPLYALRALAVLLILSVPFGAVLSFRLKRSFAHSAFRRRPLLFAVSVSPWLWISGFFIFATETDKLSFGGVATVFYVLPVALALSAFTALRFWLDFFRGENEWPKA